jgi:hypothetical protein
MHMATTSRLQTWKYVLHVIRVSNTHDCWKETSFQAKEGGLVRLIDAFRLFSPTRFFLLGGTTQLIDSLHKTTPLLQSRT